MSSYSKFNFKKSAIPEEKFQPVSDTNLSEFIETRQIFWQIAALELD